MENNRIFGLDLLRAAAILMVLFAQCIFFFPQENGLLSQLGSLSAFFGLEIFFVLSGFLFGNMLFPIFINTKFNFASVIRISIKRKFRIVPLYYLILCICLGIAIYRNYPVENSWKYFFFIQNFASPIPAFFPESWGLPVILFAGIFLLITLFAIGKLLKTIRKSTTFLIVVLILIFLGIAFKALYSAHTLNTDITQWDVSLKSVAIYRLDSVFIGTLFSWMYCKKGQLWNRFRWIFVLFGCIGMLFLIIGIGHFQLQIEYYKTFWNVVYLPLTSLIIACFLPILSCWRAAFSFIAVPINFISKISYAAYLVHYSLLIQVLERYLMPKLAKDNSQLMEFSLIYLVATFVLGTILYFLIERPCIRKAETFTLVSSTNSDVVI